MKVQLITLLAGALLISVQGSAGSTPDEPDSVAYYTCSMHPSVEAVAPGRCPRCGMDLTPVTQKELSSATIHLDPQIVQHLGARFATVEKATLTKTVVAAGVVSAKSGDRAFVEVEVHEAELSVVHVDQPALVKLPFEALAQFPAAITFAPASVDEKTRIARVRGVAEDPGGKLQPGMPADLLIEIALGERLAIPRPAVIYVGSTRRVFVERGSGYFEPRKVQLGERSQNLFEVLDGVAEGERVLVSGLFLLAAESRIRSADLWVDEAVVKEAEAREAKKKIRKRRK